MGARGTHPLSAGAAWRAAATATLRRADIVGRVRINYRATGALDLARHRDRRVILLGLTRISIPPKPANRQRGRLLAKPLKKKRICDRLFQTARARSRPSHAMSREARKRTASARDADDAPAEERRGRASAGPSGSARDAKAVKREKSQKGKAPVVEAVIELDEEEDDDEFNEQNDADIAQMVRPPKKAFSRPHKPMTFRTRP
jgi:hypothetical protein